MKFQRDGLQKLRRHSPRERSFLIQAWCALLVIDIALRCLPFPSIASFCRRLCTTVNDGDAVSLPPVTQLARLVNVAGRYSPFGTSCLKEALVLSWLMSRRGMATTLRIGVARRHGNLDAHAWLEQNGRIILGEADADAYAPLPPIPREAVHQ
ncbi:MAG: lasso peptide biosynthesis B2 protein [Nitrospiraceae bacterium]